MSGSPTVTAKSDRATALERALLRGESLTAVRAGLEFGYWRLSSLIHRLRRRGWPIRAERQHNNGLAAYRLPHGWRPTSPIDANK